MNEKHHMDWTLLFQSKIYPSFKGAVESIIELYQNVQIKIKGLFAVPKRRKGWYEENIEYKFTFHIIADPPIQIGDAAKR
jgi:hypothetical protein